MKQHALHNLSLPTKHGQSPFFKVIIPLFSLDCVPVFLPGLCPDSFLNNISFLPLLCPESQERAFRSSPNKNKKSKTLSNQTQHLALNKQINNLKLLSTGYNFIFSKGR